MDTVSLVPRARRFWADDFGRALYLAERACLGPQAERWSGVHGLEISLAEPIVDMSSVRHLMRWAPTHELAESSSTIVCHPDRLPLPDGALDLVVLHHVLEIVDCPHQLLQEAARVTAADGRLIIFGWSPVSAGGLARCLPQTRKALPGVGCWRSARRMRDWLSFVEFEIERLDYCGFHLPGLAPHNALLETLGRRHNLPLGDSYVIQARSRSQLARRQPQRPLFGTAVGAGTLGATRVEPSSQVHGSQVHGLRVGFSSRRNSRTESSGEGSSRDGSRERDSNER
ncbi:hypothetical protein BJB45_17065 [Halomonas huangheensis]|uniref:Methyltransferase type 11 domain-containing protein n=2 Tax=Halomonas huangheensis TaxID=1178482 RepID=W1NBS1_9GAMM|nr:hypothetical protein BJB45_17065 [Halomonas huangheensis]